MRNSKRCGPQQRGHILVRFLIIVVEIKALILIKCDTAFVKYIFQSSHDNPPCDNHYYKALLCIRLTLTPIRTREGQNASYFRVRVADMICGSFFVFDRLLDILPVLNPRVRWLLCILWNPPDRADADSSGNAPFAAQNLNTAGGDTPAFGGLRDG